jgi:phosphinothricin acetyltransferase
VSSGLTVRAARPDDADAIAEIYRPIVELTSISFEESAPDAREITTRMLSRPRLPWLVADLAGDAVGYTYAARHRDRAAYRWSVDCSVYLHRDHRGAGIGRKLYEHLFVELRALGYVSAFAGATLPNEASRGLHEGLGFRPVGVFRRVGFKNKMWHDVGWWQLALVASPDVPAEPREWDGPFPAAGADAGGAVP